MTPRRTILLVQLILMSSAVPLDYASSGRTRLRVRVRPAILVLSISVALLGVDAFILALPALRRTHLGSLMGFSGEWARIGLTHATWVSSVFAVVTIAANLSFPRGGWALRLARCVALGMAIFHWFFAPGDGLYSLLLWGRC
jgi:hypothetical protein